MRWATCSLWPEYKSGCYILKERAPNDYKKIPRLGGVDISGTLYIGESTDLPQRIKSLKQSIDYNIDPNQKAWIERGHKSLGKKIFRARKTFPIMHLKLL